MKKVLLTIAVLVLAQAILVGIYFVVEHSRDQATEVAAPTRPNIQLGDLEFRKADGSTVALKDYQGQRIVLHVWATWCPPCLEELPSLLNYADTQALPVIAVSVDPEWKPVREFLKGASHEAVVLADGGDVQDQLGVIELPATLIVDEAGIVRLRYDGPQDWSSETLRREVASP